MLSLRASRPLCLAAPFRSHHRKRTQRQSVVDVRSMSSVLSTFPLRHLFLFMVSATLPLTGNRPPPSTFSLLSLAISCGSPEYCHVKWLKGEEVVRAFGISSGSPSSSVRPVKATTAEIWVFIGESMLLDFLLVLVVTSELGSRECG